MNVKDVKSDYDVTKSPKDDPDAPLDWNLLRIEAWRYLRRKHPIGEQSHERWYGEGDTKVFVDGESFPSEFGTGLEDYYNTSFAPIPTYQTPFANAPRVDDPSSTGHNTFTRTIMLDSVPFSNAFSFDLEMLSWDGGTIDIATVTYWYGRADTHLKASN